MKLPKVKKENYMHTTHTHTLIIKKSKIDWIGTESNQARNL